MELQPVNVQLIGSELAVAWSDGRESYLPLEMLRRACPCAACGGEPDLLRPAEKPAVTYGAKSFELSGWQPVGGYALQFRWGDGHDSGIFSWPYLRKLG